MKKQVNNNEKKSVITQFSFFSKQKLHFNNKKEWEQKIKKSFLVFFHYVKLEND